MSDSRLRGAGTMAIIGAILLTFCGGIAGAADDPANEIGILFGPAIGDEDIVGTDDGPRGNGVIGLRYGHLFRPALGLSIDALKAHYVGALAPGDIDETGLRAALDWYFARTANTRWFLAGGLGAADFDPDTGSGETRGYGSLEVGQQIFTTDRAASFRWSIRADQTVTGDKFGDEDFMSFKGLIGGSFGLGVKPADDDGDGVVNRRDKCPDTPRGAWVDERGCPKDSDGDGVLDGLDRCPDTPKGWPVDGSGCPKDSDGDGVPDGKDKCPDTPRGAKVDDAGCPKDSDGDGVLDGLDKCPDTPRGARVDASGCPKDSDGDGVLDGLDKCPDTPRGTKVDASGCPVEQPKTAPLFTPEKKTLVLEGVNFEFDSAKLTPESLVILDQVAASLRDWPDVRVEVGGHTDSKGAAAYNLKLSDQRADAVVAQLVSKGVAASRLRSQGYGETKPIADNATDAGRARNRRVELTRID